VESVHPSYDLSLPISAAVQSTTKMDTGKILRRCSSLEGRFALVIRAIGVLCVGVEWFSLDATASLPSLFDLQRLQKS